MGEMTERNKMNRIIHFVYSFIIPRIISFDSRGQDKIFEMLQKEARLNFLVCAKEGTFQELVMRAEGRGFFEESLNVKQVNYFPHKSEIQGKYATKLFPFFRGEEKIAEKEMDFLGYRHGTGCELLHLIFEKKLRINECAIIANGSVAKVGENNECISPVLFIPKNNKLFFSIYNHDSLITKIPLYYFCVKK